MIGHIGKGVDVTNGVGVFVEPDVATGVDVTSGLGGDEQVIKTTPNPNTSSIKLSSRILQLLATPLPLTARQKSVGIFQKQLLSCHHLGLLYGFDKLNSTNG